MKKKLYLDPSEIEFGSNGIDNFYWPISHKELEFFRDDLHNKLIPLIKKNLDDDRENNWAIIRILIFEIIQQLIMIFQSTSLHRYAEKAGYQIVAPEKKFPLHSAQLNSTLPELPRFSQWLWQGLAKPNLFFRAGRLVRDIIPFRSFRRKRLWLVNKKNDTVSITTSPFLDTHAEFLFKKTGKRIVLCSFWEWMSLSKKDKNLMMSSQPVPPEITDTVINIAKDTFGLHGETLSKTNISFLSKWINHVTPAIRYYYERLIQNPHSIPSELWYGSTNHIWTRLLRAAVQHHGGRCVGHDHGRGIGTCPNNGEHGVVLDLCDEYVSYSPFLSEQFSLLNDEIIKKLPGKSAPTFMGDKNLFLPPPKQLKKKNITTDSKTQIKSIVYLAPTSFGENIFLNCLPADPVSLDWQCRLLKHINKMGCKSIYKQHPENQFELPQFLTSNSDIKIVNGYIEDCYDIADIFIFDFLSSTFRTIAFSSAAIIFIDFGLGELSKDTQKVISKRCVIIKGWYDDNNRAQINWHELQDAIELAPKLALDTSCALTLFGSKNK